MTSRPLLLSVVLMMSGCASVSTMGLARTLNQRAVQGWVGPSGGGVIALPASPGGTAASLGYPLVEGGVRIGVTDHFELGGKLGFSGIGIEGKVAFVRTPTMDSGVNVSINPGVTFVGAGFGNIFAGTLTFHLPVLIGIDFSGHELVIGPRLIDQLFFGGVGTSGAAVNLIYAGGSVGFAVKVSPGFRILPELSVGVPVFGSVAGSTATALGGGGLIFQAGLGFLFGTNDQYEHVDVRPALTPPPLPPATPAPQPTLPPAGI